MNKGLFIILDGTLITTRSGLEFPLNSEDWKFTTSWEQVIKSAAEEGYKLVIVDNQLLVGEGIVSMHNFTNKDSKICEIIEKDLHLPINTIITTYCYDEEDDFMVKPNPGLLYSIAVEYDIILPDSILIGNNDTDIEFTRRAGIRTYYSLENVKNGNKVIR